MGPDVVAADPERGEAWRYHSGVADRARKYDLPPKGALSVRTTRATDYVSNPPEGYRPVKAVLQGADMSPRNLATTLAIKKVEKARRARIAAERAAMKTPKEQDLLTDVNLEDEAGVKEARRAQFREEQASKARYKTKRGGYGWFNNQREELDADTPVQDLGQTIDEMKRTGPLKDPSRMGAISADSILARHEWESHQQGWPRTKGGRTGKIRGTVAGLGLPLLAGLAGSLIGDRW